MKYLDKFLLASEEDETNFLLNDPRMSARCYSKNNIHPFRFFSSKGLKHLEFEPITICCGSNGSGKSTLLNIIAGKLDLDRSALFNNTPFLETYISYCDYKLCEGVRLPKKSRIITSDDVFDFLLDTRAINVGVSQKREEFFRDYYEEKNEADSGKTVRMRSFDDYDKLKKRDEVNHTTAFEYVARRMRNNELSGKSNGESAYMYFTQAIDEGALYLLDEPENSLSPVLQKELAQFIEESVRFYKCQFIISTHSPFILALNGAKIYDLDERPVKVKPWSEVENVRVFRELFEKHRADFD